MASYRAFYISGPGRAATWKDKLKLAVAAVVAGAIVVTAVILSLSLALILVPVGLLAYAFRRQILRGVVSSLMRQQPQARQPERGPDFASRRGDGDQTIEVDYTVVDDDKRRPR